MVDATMARRAARPDRSAASQRTRAARPTSAVPERCRLTRSTANRTRSASRVARRRATTTAPRRAHLPRGQRARRASTAAIDRASPTRPAHPRSSAEPTPVFPPAVRAPRPPTAVRVRRAAFRLARRRGPVVRAESASAPTEVLLAHPDLEAPTARSTDSNAPRQVTAAMLSRARVASACIRDPSKYSPCVEARAD